MGSTRATKGTKDREISHTTITPKTGDDEMNYFREMLEKLNDTTSEDGIIMLSKIINGLTENLHDEAKRQITIDLMDIMIYLRKQDEAGNGYAGMLAEKFTDNEYFFPEASEENPLNHLIKERDKYNAFKKREEKERKESSC